MDKNLPDCRTHRKLDVEFPVVMIPIDTLDAIPIGLVLGMADDIVVFWMCVKQLPGDSLGESAAVLSKMCLGRRGSRGRGQTYLIVNSDFTLDSVDDSSDELECGFDNLSLTRLDGAVC